MNNNQEITLQATQNIVLRELHKLSALDDVPALDENLFEAGFLDSISGLGFIVRLQKHFNIEFEAGQLAESGCLSVNDFVRLVTSALGSR